MKRSVEHPPGLSLPNGAASERELTGPKYWRSLDELAATPGFQAQLQREFPDGASELEGVDRRQFMKIMAASFALGGVGLAGCRRPEMNILPYGKSVEGVIPGLPLYYATAMPLRKSAIPLLAETHQGRPTKIEGNPSYEPHGGAASLFAQASVLDLYDPDRATAHTKGGAVLKPEQVNELLATISRNYAQAQGAGLAFLADESSSPTRSRIVRTLRARFPRAIWCEYEPIADEPPVGAAQAAFGTAVKPVYNFAKAKRILSLDADFLQAEAGSLLYARAFSNGRRLATARDSMSRLYVAESSLTITGSMADHRLRVASSHMLALAAKLATQLSPEMGNAFSSSAAGLNVDAKWVDECAADLKEHRGECIIVAGSHLPPEVHAIVHGLNASLGNIGQTVNFLPVETVQGLSSIVGLTNAIKGGSIRTLVVLGGNPAYNAPADLDWPALQKSVVEVVRLGYHVDETSTLNPPATTHIAAAHYLESWGDARTVDGTIVPIQPMILPLFGGFTQIEVLARLAGVEKPDPYLLVAETIAGLAGANTNAEKAMQRFLHDGLLANSAHKPVAVQFNAQNVQRAFAMEAKPAAPLGAANLEVRFVADHKMDDGRFANNGWLQECPDPITKIAWDNAILVSPKLAQELGIYPGGSLIQVARVETASFHQGKEMARIGELTLNGKTIRGPLHIQPGLASYTVVLPLGYGRTGTGHVGRGAGHNFYPLRTSTGLHFATGGKLVVTKATYQLANTQEHWSMEGREIIREANLDEYQANPAFVDTFGMESHSPPMRGEHYSIAKIKSLSPEERAKAFAEVSTQIPRGNSLYETPKLDGVHQWGMSIDMNTCIGCQACVVACQAENNVPIVGKEQVLRGREMHWLRIDRYYSSGTLDAGAFGGEGNKEIPEDPQVSLQPMTCVHCELAPCETVCPVNATVHDEEGLNVMAYNRCIGTRYCANNCPYKVRRFNFFDWNQRRLDSLYMGPAGSYGTPELVQMVKNPEVSVRMRGVMEKCTYCVQRIVNGKIQHKVKMAKAGTPGDVMVPDGTIKTACEQTCPVDAIVFGNILDKESAVMKAKLRDQDYEVLGYLNTRPRTTYAARVRNPNPKMPDYHQQPLSRIEYNKKNMPQSHGNGHGPETHGVGHGGSTHGAPAHGEKKTETKKGGH
ncbi:MAG: TAT-variant-translocated molybdopterin oxidoreductase [Opitutaceae bacterium]|nr:TAT-variant-translocated molybdopterin oxidoreductase [Opitutaceae bacterium]